MVSILSIGGGREGGVGLGDVVRKEESNRHRFPIHTLRKQKLKVDSLNNRTFYVIISFYFVF